MLEIGKPIVVTYGVTVETFGPQKGLLKKPNLYWQMFN